MTADVADDDLPGAVLDVQKRRSCVSRRRWSRSEQGSGAGGRAAWVDCGRRSREARGLPRREGRLYLARCRPLRPLDGLTE